MAIVYCDVCGYEFEADELLKVITDMSQGGKLTCPFCGLSVTCGINCTLSN